MLFFSRKKSEEVKDCNKRFSKQVDVSRHEAEKLQSSILERDREIISLKQTMSDLEKQLSDMSQAENAVKIAASCSLSEVKVHRRI